MKKNKVRSVYVLVHSDTFIAAFRHKPKRVYIRGCDGKTGYYAFTDCNGPTYGSNKNYPLNIIEGSMNAKCIMGFVKYK